MDLGSVLREARERRGLSLDALSRATKINVSTLRALEASQFDRIAHGIFVRGFLRAYAQEVGLDAEQIIGRYRAEYEPAPQAAANDSPRLDAASGSHGPVDDDSNTPRTVLMLVALVAVAVAGYVMVQRSGTPPAAPPHTEPATIDTGTTAVGTAAPKQPIATTAAAPAPPEPPVPTQTIEGIRIAFRTTDDCWIEATADGKRIAFAVVPEGQERTFEARDTLVLRVGQPSALTYTINGSPGRRLGPSGQPVTVRITPANYREFVAP